MYLVAFQKHTFTSCKEIGNERKVQLILMTSIIDRAIYQNHLIHKNSTKLVQTLDAKWRYLLE